jgi:RNA polymerase sigma-70 factor (ECF subfamily)
MGIPYGGGRPGDPVDGGAPRGAIVFPDDAYSFPYHTLAWAIGQGRFPTTFTGRERSNRVNSKEKPAAMSDRELVSRVQQGDVDAFEALVHRYDKKVLSIAYSFTRDTDEAKDIYQEVFLRVWGALERFEFASEFSTWLHRIVMNVCLNQKKRHGAAGNRVPLDSVSGLGVKGPQAHADSTAVAPSPERLAEDSEIRRHVEAAMGVLSPQERLVFTLKHFEGYRLREIAAMMDCGEGTVKRYFFTATAKMRRKLGRLYR